MGMPLEASESLPAGPYDLLYCYQLDYMTFVLHDQLEALATLLHCVARRFVSCLRGPSSEKQRAWQQRWPGG